MAKPITGLVAQSSLILLEGNELGRMNAAVAALLRCFVPRSSNFELSKKFGKSFDEVSPIHVYKWTKSLRRRV